MLTTTWNAVGALCTTVSAVVIIAGIIDPALQVKEARHSRNLGLLLSFRERYDSSPADALVALGFSTFRFANV
jgi:hypothetical protein